MGRRPLLIYGAVACCVLHFISGALMASYGHAVDAVDGNSILRWELNNDQAAKAIIACKPSPPHVLMQYLMEP